VKRLAELGDLFKMKVVPGWGEFWCSCSCWVRIDCGLEVISVLVMSVEVSSSIVVVVATLLEGSMVKSPPCVPCDDSGAGHSLFSA